MDEVCFTGYCRQLDQSRIVIAEFVSSGQSLQLDCADCCFPDCRFDGECSIAQAIRAHLGKNE